MLSYIVKLIYGGFTYMVIATKSSHQVGSNHNHEESLGINATIVSTTYRSKFNINMNRIVAK